MSSGGYDAVHSPTMYQRYEPRRPAGSVSTPTYDRSFNHPPRRRSPSPGPPRRFSYDSYNPNRVELPHRNEPTHSYRPNTYRPDYSTGTYYDRSQSPDRYPHTQRTQDAEPWDRSNPWLGPVKPPSTWQDRKPLPPPSPVRERPRRDDTMATRIFEPSDAWKRDHTDRPPRLDGPPTIDRYPNYRRDSSDLSPIRQSRINRAPPIYLTGDRYRPPQEPPRDTYHGARPEYDSYRPLYEDSRVPPTAREQVSSPIYRREAVAPIHGRNSDHYEPYHGRQLSSSTSVHGSASPGTRFRSPARRLRNYSPSQEHNLHLTDELSFESELVQKNRFADPSDADTNRTKGLLSRPSSRSSIASTLHSEKREASPRSALRATPEAQSNSSHTIQASPEHLKSPSAHSASYPPDLRPINDVKRLTSVESWMKPDCPIPFRAETEVNLTGQAEDNEIILQDQSRMDLSPDQNDQTQSLPPQLSDVPRSLPTDLSPSVGIPVPPPAPYIETSAQTVLTDAPSNSLPPPSLLSAPQSDALNRGEGTSTREIQVVEISPRRDLEKVFAELPANEDTTAQTVITLQSPEKVADASVSTPHVGPIRRSVDKSAPTAPSRERAVPSSPSEEYSTKEALRVVVMTRLLCDRQTREERINPVLMANLALAPQPDLTTSEESDAEAVIRDVLTRPQCETRMQYLDELRPSLIRYFSQRQTGIASKAQHLRQEYIQLQENWTAHCHALNEQAKPSILEGETVPIGRTTRRSANLGDAVRSDLEMEQILASLESNDATDPNHLSQRNLATVPDMICVANGKIDYVFDDTSHRVQNPVEYYAACTGIHDWTEDEKNIFLDKYAAYPKQFGTIADWLPNKTSAQCVDYYYLHKKGLIDFRKVVSKLGPKRRRRGAGKRKGNALLTDIQKHDEEVHRDSGSSSITQSQNKSARGRKPKDKDTSEPKPEGERRGPGRPPSKRIAAPLHVEKTPTATPTPEPETKVRRRRIAATILSSTAPPSRTMSLTQDETEEDNPDPDPRPAKRAKRTRKIKSAAIVEDEPTTPEMESTPLLDVSTPATGKTPTSLSIQIPEQVKSASPLSVPDVDSSAAQHKDRTASPAPQDRVLNSSLTSDAHQPNEVDTLGRRDPSPLVVGASPPLPLSRPMPPSAPPSINMSPRVSPLPSDNESASYSSRAPRQLSKAVPKLRPGKPIKAKRPRISLGPVPTGRPGSPSRLLERIAQVVLPSSSPATAALRKAQRKVARSGSNDPEGSSIGVNG